MVHIKHNHDQGFMFAITRICINSWSINKSQLKLPTLSQWTFTDAEQQNGACITFHEPPWWNSFTPVVPFPPPQVITFATWCLISLKTSILRKLSDGTRSNSWRSLFRCVYRKVEKFSIIKTSRHTLGNYKPQDVLHIFPICNSIHETLKEKERGNQRILTKVASLSIT